MHTGSTKVGLYTAAINPYSNKFETQYNNPGVQWVTIIHLLVNGTKVTCTKNYLCQWDKSNLYQEFRNFHFLGQRHIDAPFHSYYAIERTL